MKDYNVPVFKLIQDKLGIKEFRYQMILAGMLTGVQDDIQCKVLAALSTVKKFELELAW